MIHDARVRVRELPVERLELRLRTTRPGALLPWIGPALRGNVGDRLRESCRCGGIPHGPECVYGHLFEPTPEGNARRGSNDTLRPLALAPAFPLRNEPQRRGTRIAVRATVLGRPAREGRVEQLAAALGSAGTVRGLGPDDVRYEVEPESLSLHRHGLAPSELPDHPRAFPGVAPRVGIGLTAPLFLTTRDANDRRRPLRQPTFQDLFRASLRVVGTAFRLHADPLDADFAALKAAAGSVTCRAAAWEPFDQRRWSSRTESRHTMRGVFGGAIYENVPWALVPWLQWAGRLHVGTHRVAGAGSWRVVLD